MSSAALKDRSYPMLRYEKSSLNGREDLDPETDGKTIERPPEIPTKNPNHIKFQTPSKGASQVFWKDRALLEKILIAICLLLLLVVLTFVILLIHVASKDADLCLSDVCVVVASGVIAAMDKTVNPCQNFYQYACGNWIKNHHGTDDVSRWNVIGEIGHENQLVLRNVLEADLNTTSTAELKAQAFYRSCIDEGRIETKGAEPLKKAITKMGGWNVTGTLDPNNSEFNNVLSRLFYYYGEQLFFTFYVSADDKFPSENRIQIGPPRLLLPDAGYMLNSSDVKVIDAYMEYMATVVTLLGTKITDNVTNQLDGIIKFGTQIANLTQKDSSHYIDPESLYNKMTIQELQEISTEIKWFDFFRFVFQDYKDIVITENEPIIVMEPDLLTDMSLLIKNTDPVVVNNYMIWHAIVGNLGYLGEDFRKAQSKFEELLQPAKPPDPKWRECIKATDVKFGDALGALFVRTAFNGESKKTASEMVQEIISAFKRNLPSLDWMDDDTRIAAKEKANAVIDLIGFPDYILDQEVLDASYESVCINETEFFDNSVAMYKFVMHSQLAILRKPLDRKEWEFTPLTVNAYYSPNENEMVFPASILQAPFYDKVYPKALNFGGMGVLMGHELTHGFDDSGREFDKDGNLKVWWNNDTFQRFKDQIQCIVDQYSDYTINGKQVNGKLTLVENIADNGGLKSAYYAYEDWIREHGEEKRLPGIGVTNRQLFFLGFAQVWCTYSTPEIEGYDPLTDLHGPSKYRVVGSLSNSKEFSREFNCPRNSPMNPENKCEIW